jgi:hypothetical protein
VRDKATRRHRPLRAFQNQSLNVHVDFSLFQRLALPVAAAKVKYLGIKIHATRMIRLMQVLHGGTLVSGWRTQQIHNAILTTYKIAADRYGLNQLRYDLQTKSTWTARSRRTRFGFTVHPRRRSSAVIRGRP